MLMSFAVVVFGMAGETPAELRAAAQAALKAGDLKQALTQAEKACVAEPNNPEGYFLRAEAHSRLRDPAKAIVDYEAILKLDPTAIVALNLRGGERFKLGKIKESIDDFDAYLKVVPQARESHWQRGISLYYAGRFADGAKQFEEGKTVYGNDVENVFWHFLCRARIDGTEKARGQLLTISRDRRVPMMAIDALLRGKNTADDVLKAVDDANLKGEERKEALFYAHLYLGLYFEATGKPKDSETHLKLADESYRIGHYMGDVAHVHRILRKAGK